jgi:hypothetical protein
MSTRNLGRTIIECGQHRQEQASRRSFLRGQRRLRFDLEGNRIAGKEKRRGGKWFIDHLNPLERWMRRQVGRGWRHVFRELCAMADGRTLKGRHLREHVRGMVGSQAAVGWSRTDYFVDRRGILRRRCG